MAHSHKSMLRSFARMTEAQLRDYIASQEEIERRCPNPTKANKTLHDLYTRWAREELARRPAQGTGVAAASQAPSSDVQYIIDGMTEFCKHPGPAGS